MTSPLFSPITFRELTLRNRIGVSPMCQYSSKDGFATDWHLAHLGSRASGGAGLVMTEATAVSPEGRITPGDLGLWKDEHISMLSRVTAFVKSQGAAVGVQLAHAGRKASMDLPWNGGKLLTSGNGGWETLAPSAIPFNPADAAPLAMTAADIEKVKADFVAAAKRAVTAGFQVIEIHAAHGYLLHEFLSPLSNTRDDAYGENRRRLLNDIAEAIRAAVPEHIVVGARLSCVDWTPDGLQIEDSVETARQMKERGVDFIDCSSGALTRDAKITVGPNYQVPFAKQIRAEAKIPTAAVGMIAEAKQAEDIIRNGDADLVFLARAMLRDPYWAVHAARELDGTADLPVQYLRAYS